MVNLSQGDIKEVSKSMVGSKVMKYISKTITKLIILSFGRLNKKMAVIWGTFLECLKKISHLLLNNIFKTTLRIEPRYKMSEPPSARDTS